MKKKIIMKLAALFMTGILAFESAYAGIGENTVYAAETDTVESEHDGADSEFTGASGTGWTLDADGLLTISGDPEYVDDGYGSSYYPEWYNYSEKIVTVEVGTFKPKSTAYWFDECEKIESISFADGFDTSSVTDMSSMFNCCSNLTNLDVSGFDTSSVTDMGYMFYRCSGLTTLNVSSFDTSSVTDMSGMFEDCSGLTSLVLSGFDTSSVTDMSGMFEDCSGLTSLDVRSFDTSNVTDMSGMFYGCSGLTSLDLDGWNTSNVGSMGNMFEGCSSLTSLDVGEFDTSKVTSMGSMFSGCSSLASLDVSGWDTSKVREMYQMFKGCSSLTNLEVGGWDTSNVIDMVFMFQDCSGLTTLDVSKWDTSNVLSFYFLFDGCSGLTTLDVSRWNTSGVRSEVDSFYGMEYTFGSTRGMFSGCSSLTTLDVSKWDTSHITDIGLMFEGCRGLTSIDVSGWNTTNVGGMQGVFEDCSGLTSLDLSDWDTSNVGTMAWMFYRCSGLTSLDLDGWNTSNVRSMAHMFYGCSGLTSLDVSGFDTTNVTDMYNMFGNCSGLTSLDLSGWDTSKLNNTNGMFMYCDSIERIKPPLELSKDLSLPLKMYDINGISYKAFPKGLTKPMTLYASTPTSVSASSVSMKKKTLTIDTEDRYKLSYTHAPFDCTDEPVWTSSDSSIVSVNSVGMITSNTKEGTAVITVSLGLYSDSCEVTVTPSFTGASGTGWILDSDGLLTISEEPEINQFVIDWDTTIDCPEWYNYHDKITKVKVEAFKPNSTESWFWDCDKIESISFSSGFDTSNVTDMSFMFVGCSGLTSLDLSGFDTSNVKWMQYMFKDCSELTSLNLNGWDTSNVTGMSQMFNGCSSLTSLDLSRWDTSNVSGMDWMFYGCSGLTSLNLSGWDISSITTCMFEDCSNLTSLNLSGWDTSNATYMGSMFSGCSSLTSLDVSGWDTSNVSCMGWMFGGCSGLTSLDVSGWDTSNVTDMNDMFSGCSGLTSLDVSGWNTSNVTDMSDMFSGCSGLTCLDVSGFDTSNIFNKKHRVGYIGIFDGCKSIESIKPFVGLNGNLGNIALPLAKMYDIKGTEYITFPKGLTEPMTLYASVPTASPATSVTMKKKALSIDTEKRYKLSYTYAPLNCTDEPVWTSSDSSIVSVNSVGLITSHSKEGTAVITVSLGSYSDSCEVTVKKSVKAYSIVFDANGGSGSMAPQTASVGEEISLSQNTFEKADNSFSGWNTSADGSGTAYADKAKVKDLAPADGSVTLYAQWKKHTSEPTEITPTVTPTSTVSDQSASENNAGVPIVTPTPTPIPEFDNGDTISTKSISGLPKGAQTLDAGGSVNLKPVVKTADGANVSPAWLAPVGHVLDAIPQADGGLEIKAVGPGTAYVTVVSGTKTKTVKYTVKQAVKTVDTSVNAITLGVSEKYRLYVIPDAPTTDKFYFESSDKNICSVDQKGLIKAKKTEGSATITIYAYDKKSDKKNCPVASVAVTVESKEAPAVSVTDASINYLGNKELYVGEMGYISTLVNGGANNGGAAVKYKMDSKGIIKIDSYGHVTAKKAGTVTITATCGEKTDSVTLTVKQPLKLYKVNKSYVKVAAPKAGKSSKKVTFTVKTNPTAKKFTDGGGRVTWTITSKDTGISLKSDDGKGKAVFEVPSGASDTIVTATISDPVTGKTYSTDCMIDVK